MSTAGSCQASQEAPNGISNATSRLSSVTQGLLERFKMLSERLAPLLVPEQPRPAEDPSTKTMVQPHTSQAALDLHHQVGLLEELRELITDLADRVDA